MMSKNIFSALALLLLSACGQLGPLNTAKQMQAPPSAPAVSAAPATKKVSDSVALAYYKTVGDAAAQAASNARLALEASRDVAKSIGSPLAPDAAVKARQELAITGNSKTFDVAKMSPPEPLLPLAQERTKQVQALAAAMRRAMDASQPDIAAPDGFVPAAPQSLDALDVSIFDLLPATVPEPPEEGFLENTHDKYEDVKADAEKLLRDEEKK